MKPFWQRKIAKERIKLLFRMAASLVDKNPEISRRYIKLLRKIGLRYNVRLGKEIKRSICKNCNALLIPGKTARVRINSRNKTIIIRCLACGSIKRYGYAKEKKK